MYLTLNMPVTHVQLCEKYIVTTTSNITDHKIFIVYPILTNEAAFLLLESGKTQVFLSFQNN